MVKKQPVELFRAVNNFELLSLIHDNGLKSKQQLQVGNDYMMHFQIEGRWVRSVGEIPSDLAEQRVIVSYTAQDMSRITPASGLYIVTSSLDDYVRIEDCSTT